MTVEIVYETHSISEDNERGFATWLDGRLSAAGREGAKELGERRRDDGIDAVFVSDLGRAVETAEIAFGGSDIPVHRDARLRECNYGEWNGGPVERLHAERSRRIDTPFPGGESYRDTVTRMDSFLADLARDWDGRRVVVIGHASTRFAIDHLIKGVPVEDLVDAPFAWQEGWEYRLDWR